jgi:hypothetical protein
VANGSPPKQKDDGDDGKQAVGGGAGAGGVDSGGTARLVGSRILKFIAARYGAKNLLELPAHVGAEVVKRPADFVRAARRYCQPELF